MALASALLRAALLLAARDSKIQHVETTARRDRHENEEVRRMREKRIYSIVSLQRQCAINDRYVYLLDRRFPYSRFHSCTLQELYRTEDS